MLGKAGMKGEKQQGTRRDDFGTEQLDTGHDEPIELNELLLNKRAKSLPDVRRTRLLRDVGRALLLSDRQVQVSGDLVQVESSSEGHIKLHASSELRETTDWVMCGNRYVVISDSARLEGVASYDSVEDSDLFVRHGDHDFAIPMLDRRDAGCNAQGCVAQDKDNVGVIVEYRPNDETDVFRRIGEDGNLTTYAIDYNIKDVSGVVLFCKCQDNGEVVIDEDNVHRIMKMCDDLAALSIKVVENPTGLYRSGELKFFMHFGKSNDDILVQFDYTKLRNSYKECLQGQTPSSAHGKHFVQTLQRHVSVQLSAVHERGEQLVHFDVSSLCHDIEQYVRPQRSEKVLWSVVAKIATALCGVSTLIWAGWCIGIYGLVRGFKFNDDEVVNSKANIGFACAMIVFGVLVLGIAASVLSMRGQKIVVCEAEIVEVSATQDITHE